MSVPQLATYMSQDGTVKIQIKGANPANGEITGVIATNSSPQGPFNTQGTIGHYAWVANSQGKSGQAPFNINFVNSVRPDGFPYCIVDMWNGAYQTGNTMQLAGTRAYVNNQGLVQLASLGIQTFTQ